MVGQTIFSKAEQELSCLWNDIVNIRQDNFTFISSFEAFLSFLHQHGWIYFQWQTHLRLWFWTFVSDSDQASWCHLWKCGRRPWEKSRKKKIKQTSKKDGQPQNVPVACWWWTALGKWLSQPKKKSVAETILCFHFFRCNKLASSKISKISKIWKHYRPFTDRGNCYCI